jgi:hypothetical protein
MLNCLYLNRHDQNNECRGKSFISETTHRIHRISTSDCYRPSVLKNLIFAISGNHLSFLSIIFFDGTGDDPSFLLTLYWKPRSMKSHYRSSFKHQRSNKLNYQNLELRQLLAGDITSCTGILGEFTVQAQVDVPSGVYTPEEIEAFHNLPFDSAWSSKTPPAKDSGAEFRKDRNNEDILTVVLDFKEPGQGTTSDIFGFETEEFDVTAYGFAATDFDLVAEALLAEVNEDYFSELIGTVAGPENMELEINFLIGDIGTAPEGVSEYYFIQIGDGGGGTPLGVAGGGVIRNAAGSGPNGVSIGDVVGSVFTDAIVTIGGLNPSDALTSGNLELTTNGIGGTLSHEIGHALSLSHISNAGSVQPTAGAAPIMGTGAIDLPNQLRITDREFSLSGVDGQSGDAPREHIQQLVDAIGLRPIDLDIDDQIIEALDGLGVNNGVIDEPFDVDLWQVEAQAGDLIEIDIDIPSEDLDSLLRLFDEDGNQLAISDDDEGPGNEPHNRESFISFVAPTSGNYYFGVSAFNNINYDPTTGLDDVDGLTLGNYQLIVDVADADDQISEAIPAPFGSTIAEIVSGADVDMWQFNATTGQQIDIDIDIAGQDLDSLLRVFDSAGNELAVSDDDAGPGAEPHIRESFISFTAPADGVYFIGVSSFNNVAYDPVTGEGDNPGSTTGTYELILGNVAATNALIVGQQIFYNGSSFDGTSDADAASGKTALLPGQTATFANYSSYSKGINGMILDASNLATVPTLSNIGDFFEFRIGNDNDVDQFAIAPAPTNVSFAANVDGNGTDQIFITWADNAIQNTWLEVTSLANATTGLATPFTFYFGNAIGETGNDSGNAQVNLIDVGLTRANQTGLTAAAIDNLFDFDRDGRVNLIDVGIARVNQSGLTPLQLISPPSSSNRGVSFNVNGSTKESAFVSTTGSEIPGREIQDFSIGALDDDAKKSRLDEAFAIMNWLGNRSTNSGVAALAGSIDSIRNN